MLTKSTFDNDHHHMDIQYMDTTHKYFQVYMRVGVVRCQFIGVKVFIHLRPLVEQFEIHI